MQFYFFVCFLYIFLHAAYIVPPGAHHAVAQNVARQLLFLKATKFIVYTYYVSFS